MGTLTITTTTEQDARIVAAFGRRLGLAGNASAAQVKAEVIQFVRNVVESYEADLHNATRVVTPLNPT